MPLSRISSLAPLPPAAGLAAAGAVLGGAAFPLCGTAVAAAAAGALVAAGAGAEPDDAGGLVGAGAGFPLCGAAAVGASVGRVGVPQAASSAVAPVAARPSR